MRPTLAAVVLLLAGCGDAGGPRVAADAKPAPAGSPGAAAGRTVTGPAAPPPSPGRVGTLKP
jgi:hypothetical protein